MFTELSAFFVTGTGNSYKLAKWAAEVAAQTGVPSRIQRIKTRMKWDFVPNSQHLLVFSCPTHGFTAPWLMIKQVFRLPNGNGASAAVMPTRAGIRVRGICFPGMEGTAGYLLALILALKGYKVRGVLGIDMPSNWTALHWGMNQGNADFIISAAEPKAKHFVKKVLAEWKYFDGIVPLLIGLCLAPISFMYLILAQLMLAKMFFASNKCVKCGACIKFCHKTAIRMNQGRPYWAYSCDSCMACMNYCPQQAIEISPIYALAIYYITFVSASTWLLDQFPTETFPVWLKAMVQYVYILISVGVSYLILHTLLRLKAFRWFLTKLSHTHYYRRYHGPDITESDLPPKN